MLALAWSDRHTGMIRCKPMVWNNMRASCLHRLIFAGLLALLQAVCITGYVSGAMADTRVFAAASLKTALDEVGQLYRLETGNSMVAAYAGSSVLARQIAQGAPADIFVSANTDWMDSLDTAGQVRERVDLLGNRLVVITGASGSTPTGGSLTIGTGRVAMAMVASVPAGIYGREALTSLGLWDDVEDRAVQTDNVRAALRLVAIGAAKSGIVYQTDAMAEPRVQIFGTFPEDSHTPIIYPAGLLTSARPESHAFWQFLQSEAAQEVFLAHGFLIPEVPE